MKNIFFFLACLLFSFLQAQIIELDTMKDLLKYTDNDTLVLIDFDNCLFQSKTCYGHNFWFAHYIKKIRKKTTDIPSYAEKFYPRWLQSQKYCEISFLEPCIPNVIKKIQNKKIPIIGFTHRRASISLSTLHQLQKKTLSFTKTSPLKTPIYFSYKNNPKFLEGILFIHDFNEKGEILLEFLKHLPHLPKKIIAVDDTLRHLQSVKTSLKDLPIIFLGFHYRKCEKYQKNWNNKVAKIQEKLCGKILSNKAAKKLLQNP